MYGICPLIYLALQVLLQNLQKALRAYNLAVVEEAPRQHLPKCHSCLRKSVHGSKSGLEHCISFKRLFVLGERRRENFDS